MSSLTSAYKRRAWDDAMSALLVEQPGLGGDALLAAVLVEASDSLVRLREQGLVNDPYEEENEDDD